MKIGKAINIEDYQHWQLLQWLWGQKFYRCGNWKYWHVWGQRLITFTCRSLFIDGELI